MLVIIDLCDAVAQRGMLGRKRDLIVVVVWATTVFEIARGQLIRPVHIYEGLIKDIHDRFNNTCIILLHAKGNPIESQDLMEGDHLMFLQKYLSSRHIRTATIDFNMFKKRIGQSYHHIKRPLFVILNDYEDARNQFSRQIAKWIAMAYPTWLIFVSNETKLTDFFLDIYVPFDCEFLAARSTSNGSEIITEVYRIDETKELRSMRFGTWDTINGLQGPRHGLYHRRDNLFGKNIRVVSVHDPPISLFRRNERKEITGMSGFFGYLILLLQEGLNCTFTYKEAKTWGTCRPNSTCTGAVEMLMKKEVDFATTEFMMTSDRIGIVSFTTPIYTTRFRAYIKRPVSINMKWNVYTAPFSSSIWAIVLFFIIIMSGSILFIQRLFALTSLRLKIDDQLPLQFSEILFYVMGAFCGQGMAQSKLDPVRMVHFVIHLTAVIILAAYSAALISFLTVNTFVMPFTTIEGLLNDGTYRFGTIGDSADFSFFQDTSDKKMKMLYEQVLRKETDLPINYMDGLRRVCEEDKYAFVTLDNMAAILQNDLDCKLEPLDVIRQSSIAMALQPNSPYRGIIDSKILLLKDGGIMQRLMQSQWSIQLGGEKSMWMSVEIGDIMPLLLLMGVALFVSSVVYTMEYISYKNHLKRMKLRTNMSRQRRI